MRLRGGAQPHASRRPPPGRIAARRRSDAGVGCMRCELIVRTRGGKGLSVLIQDEGDPGNRITTKCVCEAALSLMHPDDRLPGASPRGGVLTPALGACVVS